MQKIFLLTVLTLLWCLVLLAGAAGLVLKYFTIHTESGGEYLRYVVAGGLAVIAILSFLHTWPGLISSALLTAYLILSVIVQILNDAAVKAWPGMVITVFGLVYVWAFFKKRKTLKELQKKQ